MSGVGGAPSGTPEAFDVVRIGAEIGRQPLRRTEDAEPLGALEAILRRRLVIVLLNQPTDDRGRTGPFPPGVGPEPLPERPLDADGDAVRESLPPGLTSDDIATVRHGQADPHPYRPSLIGAT